MFDDVPIWKIFRADSLAWVMAALIVFVVTNVAAYSGRYLAGDRHRHRHLRDVLLLGASVLVMVFSDHLLVLLGAWMVSNALLVRLMIHNGRWAAARNAGLLAMKSFALGGILLSAGFWLLASNAGTASIQELTSATWGASSTAFVGLLLVALAAMSQSATWPFHRWLTSSLNSPTPVSALMHAGLVNGGGFLLVRFAPLLLARPILLQALFVAGLVTAVVGTFWKLLQPDVKRMLACSTMGQMGFMLMQCGMGLFAPAVSHLCWHGLFKAYLFLNAGSVVREKRRPMAAGGATPTRLLMACLVGGLGALAFTWASGLGVGLSDTGCLMSGMAFMAAAQLAHGLLEMPPTRSRLFAMPVVGLGAGGIYGLNVRLIDSALSSMNASRPQPLNALYVAGFAVIFLAWLAMNSNIVVRVQSASAWKRLYVAALNGSQPHRRTVTAIRTAYHF